MPGRSHRKGITTIELFQLFPDDDRAAEKWLKINDGEEENVNG